jgi:hypothetical protein
VLAKPGQDDNARDRSITEFPNIIYLFSTISTTVGGGPAREPLTATTPMTATGGGRLTFSRDGPMRSVNTRAGLPVRIRGKQR